jgi:hypothetical protein
MGFFNMKIPLVVTGIEIERAVVLEGKSLFLQ